MPAIIQNTPVFTPFSFEQYIAPLTAYKQEYDAVEKQYNEVEAAASALEALAASAPNSQAYRTYRDYIDGLRAEADALAYNGLTPGSRQRLRNIRTGYTSNIVPILTGMQKWEEAKKRQANLKYHERLNQNPDEMSIDDFIGANPSFRIIDLNSAYTIAQQQGAAQSSRQQGLYNTAEGQKVLGEEYWYLNKLNGYVNGTTSFNTEVKNTQDLLTALAEGYESTTGQRASSAGLEGIKAMLQGVGLEDLNNSTKKELLSMTLSGYLAGLSGEVKEEFLGRKIDTSGGGTDQSLPGAQVGRWTGAGVSVNQDVIDEYTNDLEFLANYNDIMSQEYNADEDPIIQNLYRNKNQKLPLQSDMPFNEKDYDDAITSNIKANQSRIQNEKNEAAKRFDKLKQKYGLQHLTAEEARIQLQEYITNNKQYAAKNLPEYTLHLTQSKQMARTLIEDVITSHIWPQGSKQTNKLSDETSIFVEKKEDKKKKGITQKDWNTIINDPNLIISVDSSITNPDNPKYGALQLRVSGQPTVYVSPHIFKNIPIVSSIVPSLSLEDMPIPNKIKEKAAQQSWTTINDLGVVGIQADDFIKNTLNLYNYYIDYWNNHLTKQQKQQGGFIEPKILLSGMLEEWFRAFKVVTDTQAQEASATNSKAAL